jgi:adhesin transport system membrane fusion protein
MIPHAELAYVSDSRARFEPRFGSTGWAQLLAVVALVAAAVVWARWATLEEVTVGVGRVIPAKQVQVVQSLEGGIVREVLVRDGERVERDQPILKIDDTSFSARLGELSQRRAALKAEAARLAAEAEGLAEPDFAGELGQATVAAERAAFAARRARLLNDIALTDQQTAQREQELAELEARQRKIKAALEPLRREYELNRQLQRRGNVAEVDVLRLERQLAEMEGDREIVAASIERVRAGIAESRARGEAHRSLFLVQVYERIAAVSADLSVTEESLKAAADRVIRTTVRAPAHGTVNKLAVTTIGAVVQPGQPLADIVPSDDTLVIETRISPKDVAFIHPGQKASVKFTAYDYLVYGALEGKVERISPDTIRDASGETFYLIVVKTDQATLEGRSGPLSVLPGMVASVDIQTGEKSVMDYLLKPIRVVRHEAMRER